VGTSVSIPYAATIYNTGVHKLPHHQVIIFTLVTLSQPSHIWLSAISLTKAGRVAQAVPTTDGLTSYPGTTTTRHQLTCGEDPPVEKIHHMWSYGSDAMVLDNYALTTTSHSHNLVFLLAMIFTATNLLLTIFSSTSKPAANNVTRNGIYTYNYAILSNYLSWLSWWCSSSVSDLGSKGRWFDSRPGRYPIQSNVFISVN